MWVNQGFKCAIDGSFCKLEDMDYGHTDVPRSMGIAAGAETSKDANKLVEEFMLLANKQVAAFIGKQKPEKP